MSLAPPRRSRIGLLVELVLVAVVLIGTKALYDLVDWRFAGPVSMGCTITTIALISFFRKESWANFGFRKLRRWWSGPLILPQALLGVVVILAFGAGTAYLGDFLGLWDVDSTPEGVEARWGNVEGNLPVYLLWLAIIWTSAAFGEEIFFRGYLIDRVGRFLPDARWASFIAILIPAIIFGSVHAYYQGFRGFVVTGLIGLALGALYLANKRNLWPNILAHGAVDTLGFTAMYLGLDL